MSLANPTLATSERFGLYGKALAAAAVSALSAYSTALQDGHVTPAEWIAVAIALVGSFGLVWAVPNAPRAVAKYGKLITAGVAAVLSSLAVGMTSGSLSQAEVLAAIAAGVVASGLTGSISNAAASDPVDATTGRLVAIPAVVKDAMTTGSTTVVRTQGDSIALAQPDK